MKRINPSLFLREDLAVEWSRGDPFRAALEQRGVLYRDKEGRRTLRFEYRGRGYFLKLHQGVGWKEIVKNLAQGRLPVLGAENEYRAIRALERLHIDTLSVAAYGRRGRNPATQLSFLITDELQNVESLEDVCARWPQQPPHPAVKRKLIERVAALARTLHHAGINHRDFYLCHFLLEKHAQQPETQAPPANATPTTSAELDTLKLYLMDLHRAQIRARVPKRWLIKDLGGLYYSALDIGLSQRDILRFLRHYTQRDLRRVLRDDRSFWLAVRERARRIYRRDFGREPESAAWQQEAFLPAFLHGARKLPNRATLSLRIDDNFASFQVDGVLRLLPRKRLVLKGWLRGRLVVVKLFVRSASSTRHIQRERAGHARVTAAGVDCPALLGHVTTRCGQFEGLIYDFVAAADTMSDVWPLFSVAQKREWLGRMLHVLQLLHRAGAYQSDIHADNFLLREDNLCLLDLGSIECDAAPLSRVKSIRNLGALVAQFTLGERALFAPLVENYFSQRGWRYTTHLQGELETAVAAAWQARKRDYLRKAHRDCTLTTFEQSFRQLRAYRRSWQNQDLLRFFREPETFMMAGTVLKAGNTATVVKTEFASTPVVIKRYNIKNWRHALSRALRPTRAEHSWRYAHLLELAGIDSVRPLALLENRLGPLRSAAYLVGTWLDAPDLLATGLKRPLAENELDALRRLLRQMQIGRLSHGDFKANNLLLSGDRIAIIDLDAMREHRNYRSWRKAFDRDIARLLRNWPQDSAVFRQVKAITDSMQANEDDTDKR